MQDRDKHGELRVGVVMYPGSNGHQDMVEWFRKARDKVITVWHVPSQMLGGPPRDLDLLVLPGGFAYGDREYSSATGQYSMAPGKMASTDPVSEYIRGCIKEGTTVFGVCNGFQTLIHMGLLPGKLAQNNAKRFECANVQCVGNALGGGSECLNVANEYGHYILPRDCHGRVNESVDVILRYNDTEYSELNGSEGQIAGVASDDNRVFGMMPHPERTYNQRVLDWIRNIARRRYRCRVPISVRAEQLMTSEHVAYGRTKEILKRLPTKDKEVLVGPGENAGVIRLSPDWAVAIRIESHNHPTYIDPYQGAATGLGGMVRDILAVGAKPIAHFDFLRFGTDKRSDTLLPLAVRGIADYGNCLGIPNVGGDLKRGSCYDKNPLMNAACVGLVRCSDLVLGNVKNAGSKFVCVGGRTGREGVGGAHMASASLPDSEEALDMLRSTVQTGDAFLERLLLEACSELGEAGVLEGMQDLGAGGLLCASVEMVQRGRKLTGKPLGCTMWPGRLAIKGNYLDMGELLVSESQERMLLCVSDANIERVMAILTKWDLEAQVVGEINESGQYSVNTPPTGSRTVCAWKFDEDHNLGELLCDLSIDDAVNGGGWESADDEYDDHTSAPELMKSNAVPVNHYKGWSQYDSTIGARNLLGPNLDRRFSLLNVPEAACRLGVVWGNSIDDCMDRCCTLDDHVGEKGTPLGVVNGLNFGDPKVAMPGFEAAVTKLAEECKSVGVSVVGGNVSMHNATAGKSIPGEVMLVMLVKYSNA